MQDNLQGKGATCDFTEKPFDGIAMHTDSEWRSITSSL
jgi:hypothetical protein